MDRLYLIKIGGNIVDDDKKLAEFLQAFARLSAHKLLVHGGGKLATQLAGQLGLAQRMVDGRRITDAETLKVVTMVYAGLVNKNIVAQLQAQGCNALGLSGADGNALLAHKREVQGLDYGFAGDVDKINATLFQALLAQGCTPVLAPITHDGKGQLLNTNADTIAQETAKGLSPYYDVHLVYAFEKAGVLLNADDEATVIPILNANRYAALKANGQVYAGMIPKLDNAFAALECGVKKVLIGRAENLDGIINGKSGTSIVHD